MGLIIVQFSFRNLWYAKVNQHSRGSGDNARGQSRRDSGVDLHHDVSFLTSLFVCHFQQFFDQLNILGYVLFLQIDPIPAPTSIVH